MQSPLANRRSPCTAAQYLQEAEEARHVGPHPQAVESTQAERQQGHPQPAKRKQHGNRLGVVEIGDTVLTLAEAQADGQSDSQLAGLAAITLEPGQQESIEGEERQADGWQQG